MKKRILFVDDEPNLLDSIRRMLHAQRAEWDLSFAQGGEEALALMAEAPFDVVVTDMRMPGMDGAHLLARVQELHPSTIRIILSGHSESAVVLKAVKPAHQFLSKPCTPAEIKRVINRSLALRDILSDEGVRRILTRIDSMPAVPTLFLKLLEELRKEDPSVITLGDLIAQDVGMCAGVLKVVNSSFFGLRTHVSSPHQAINLLGTETVKALVLSVNLFTRYTPDPALAFDFSALWRHSARVAVLARTIGQMETSEACSVDWCAMAGLLHDVGKLVLAAHFTPEYVQVLETVRRENQPLHLVERAMLGVTHAEVGAYLLGLWGLDEAVVEAVFHHHSPARQEDSGFTVLAAVHAANCLDHELTVIDPQRAPHPPDLDWLEARGLSGRLPLWRETCARKAAEEDGRGE